jgi:hypothetical protein
LHVISKMPGFAKTLMHSDKHGRTVFHCAARGGDVRFMEVLISFVKDPITVLERRTLAGETCASIARAMKHTAMERLIYTFVGQTEKEEEKEKAKEKSEEKAKEKPKEKEKEKSEEKAKEKPRRRRNQRRKRKQNQKRDRLRNKLQRCFMTY